MKKRILSLCLILTMLLTMALPAFATGETDPDAAKVADGYHFKVTASDGTVTYGKFNEKLASDNARDAAFANVPTGATVTILTDVTVTNEVHLNGVYTIDGNGKTLNARFRTDASTANVTVKNANLDVTLTTANGYFYQIAAGNTCVFENCSFDIKGEPASALFIPRGDLTLKDCTFKYTTSSAKPVFYNETNNYVRLINTTFDLSGAPNAKIGVIVGVNNKYNTQFAMMMRMVNEAEAGSTLSLIDDFTVENTGSGNRFELNKKFTIDGNGHSIKAKDGFKSPVAYFSSGADILLKNISIVQGNEAMAVQINAGAKITLENATVQCTAATSYVMVQRGTLILNAGAKILAGDAEKVANGFLADDDKATLIVNRGAEINVSGQLYSAKRSSAVTTINGGTFTIGGKLLYRDPTADEFKNNDVTLRLPNGGVATKNNSGIRFTTVVDKAWYEAMIAAGVTVEKTGTLVAPKAFVDAAGAFTPEALEAAGKLYLDIENNGWYNGDSGDAFYYYYGNMVKLSAASINGELAGIGYMVVTVEGLGTFTVYGTQKNGIVSEIAASKTAEDDAQQAILDFFRGSAN